MSNDYPTEVAELLTEFRVWHEKVQQLGYSLELGIEYDDYDTNVNSVDVDLYERDALGTPRYVDTIVRLH